MTDVLPHNLRTYVTGLVGRSAELSQLTALVATHRLVTVAGPGGSGKTRLAAEVSERIVRSPVEPPDGPDELRWLDLSSISDPSEVVYTCAHHLGVRLRSDTRDPLAALVARLRRRRPMLVFDTCEHLLEPVGDVIEAVLHECPGASVLVTSREPLGVAGEAVWRVPALTPSDAADLFVERALLVTHDSDLRATDEAVTAICSRLDGLPLAVELASGWMRVFTASQILAGLDERFRLLTGGSRRGTPRHRTLEASMEWSHDLLSPAERLAFRRLSVLVGDFGLAAAEEICGEPPEFCDDEPVAVLARLVDKSLLEIDRGGGEARYRMLTTVRHFALNRLAAADESARVRDRHLSWCLRTMHGVQDALARDQDVAMRQFDEVAHNAMAALDWAFRPGDARRRDGRLLAHLMVTPWFLRSDSRRGVPMLNRAVATTVAPDDDLHRLLTSDLAFLGIVSARFGLGSEPGQIAASARTDRLARARAGLAHAYETFFFDLDASRREAVAASVDAHDADDPFTEDFALILAAYTLSVREDHDAARRLVAPADERARARGDRFCGAFALGVEQYAAMRTGHVTAAVQLGREMTAMIAPLGDDFGLGFLTEHLALALCMTGDLDGARRVMAPIVDIAEATDEVDVVALPVVMGHICLRAGEWDDAAAWFLSGLTGLDHGRPDWTVARCLPGAVDALRRRGDAVEAGELLSRGQELGITTSDYAAGMTEQSAHLLPDGDPLAAVLHHRALAIRIRAGIRTLIPDSLDALARLHAVDDPAQALHLLAASTAAREAMAYPRALGDMPGHDRLLDDLRTTLGNDAFDEAWHTGSELSLDQAGELAQSDRRRPARPDAGWASLTPTELAVVRLVTDGMTNPEIAQRLVVSRATVKTHLYHVFTKLDISNRTELAAMAHGRLAPHSSE